MEVAFLLPEASQRMQEQAGQEPTASPGSLIGKILLAQLGLGVVLAGLLWGMYGRAAGYSALLGALICVIPNAFLGLRLVLPRRDAGAGGLLQAAYLGELGKVALTVILFGAVFVMVRPLSAAALFAGFIAAQLVTFAGFLMRDGGQTDKAKTSKE
jgi:ATP synthase protein I